MRGGTGRASAGVQRRAAVVGRRTQPLLLLAVVAILLNVVQFRAIDLGTVDHFDALNRNATGDILDLTQRECAWCRDRYGLALALRVIAPGARVSIPTDSHYAADRYTAEEITLRLVALGGVDSVTWVPPAGLASLLSPAGALDPAPYVIATGPGGEKGAPWAVAVDPARRPAGELPEPAEYLETALARGDHREPPGPARDFLILRWEQPREGSRHSYQDLAVEASLLPPAVREAAAP